MADRVAWMGRVVDRRWLSLRASLLAFPAAAWMTVLVVLPTLGFAALALMTRTPQGQVEATLTFEHVLRAVGLTDAGFVPDTLRIAFRTLGAATFTSAACIALAFPTALWIASRPPHRRPMLLALAAIPLGTNIVVRSYAWMLVLGPGSPVAVVAGALGFIEPGSSLHPSWLAVSLGMIAASLPLAIISLYASVERLDWRLLDAARDLHASRLRAAWHGVVVPAWPGLLAAFTLTFVPALGSFVIPDLLGGAKHWMIGNLVQQQFGTSRNWPYGAALGLLLVAGTIPAVVMLARRRAAASEAGGGVPRASRLAAGVAALSGLLLYLPILAVVVASFAATKTGLSFGQPTLEWYRGVFRDARLLELATNTLTLAAVSTVIATALGTMLAVSLERFPWRPGLRSAMDGILTLPVVMPDVLLAAGVVVALGVLRGDAQFLTDHVKADHRPFGQVLLGPKILAGAGQSAQDHDARAEIPARRRQFVPALVVAEKQIAFVVVRELVRPVQAAKFGRLLPELPHLGQQLVRVGADPAAGVRLGHDRQPVAPGGLADLDRHAGRVFAVSKEKRHQVMPDDGADRLAVVERNPQSPEDVAGADCPAPGMPARRPATVGLAPGADRLGDVVEQGGHEQNPPFGLRQGPPDGQAGHFPDHHVDVRPHIPLRVAVGVLRAALQILHPRKRIQTPPGDGPVRFRRKLQCPHGGLDSPTRQFRHWGHFTRIAFGTRTGIPGLSPGMDRRGDHSRRLSCAGRAAGGAGKIRILFRMCPLRHTNRPLQFPNKNRSVISGGNHPSRLRGR